jgi:plastocyanin
MFHAFIARHPRLRSLCVYGIGVGIGVLAGLVVLQVVLAMPQATVAISGFRYLPQDITIRAGETITWTNQDSAPHTVTADDGAFDSGNLTRNMTYTRSFTQTGVFSYTCTIHPSMTGTVRVISGTQSLVYAPIVARPGTPVAPAPPVAAGAGRWSDPATWGAQVPQAGAAVRIPAGKSVLLDVSPPPLAGITLDGQLIFDASKDLNLSADWIMVHGGGKLQIGTAQQPYLRRAAITLTGKAGEDVMGMGTKFVGAMMGGKIEIYGEDRVSWTQLAATASAGAGQITLKEAVDWRAGETLVIASTALDPSQAEVRVIAAISQDRRTLTLDKPLLFTHFGQLQTFAGKTLDARAEVALLSRNIVIQGDESSAASQFGGHVMVMGASTTTRETNPDMRGSARIQGVELRRMGQFDRLGRYPLHWHLNGDATGDFVRDSAFHSNFQRGVVVHGTDNARVEGNVVFGSVGHSFGTEDGSETGNVFDGNLGVLTQPFSRKATNPIQAGQNDDQAATFWIRGANNRFVNNHAAGGLHTAFWFDDVGRVDGSRFEFRDNVAHSYLIDGNTGGDVCCAGFEKAALWFTGEGFDIGYRGPFTVTGMTLYKNRTALWGNPRTIAQGFADVRLSDSILADNIMGLNSHGATNTVIVGRSANPDTVDTLGAQGVQEYGHSQRLVNVTFVNFQNGASAIEHRNCAREAGNVTATGTTLVNAQINLCSYSSNANTDMTIADTNGALVGNGRPATLAPAGAGSRAMYTQDCALNAGLGMRVCDGLLRYSNLHLRGAAVTLTRDDGVTLDAFDISNYPFYWTTIEGRRYTVNGNVAAQPSLEFTLLGKYEDDNADRSARVTLAATAPFDVYAIDTNWFSPPAANRNGMTQLTPVASLAALEGSAVSAYYYDGAAQVIHLKLWTSGLNRVYIDRR